MSLFANIKKSLRQAAENRGKARTCEQLLRMSDRQLVDYGFSKVLLLEGPSAWPWRAHEESNGVKELAAVLSVQPEKTENQTTPSAREIRRAIKELSAYSDRELTEMGISRGSIKEVVRTGRNTEEAAGEDQKRAA